MTFMCPACRNTIRHSETEAIPRTDVIYRCAICRLELVVDAARDVMIVAPFPTHEDDVARKAKPTSTLMGRTQAAEDRDRNRNRAAVAKTRKRARPR
jgi:hypothetical protein